MTKPNSELIRKVFKDNNGIFRMIPVFVPRRASSPGMRLRLHPDDLYALGLHRGPIKERWFSSIIKCSNGPDTAPDEGLSYVSYSDDPNDRFLFRDAVEELGAELIGEDLMKTYGTWPMYSKFFDFGDPLPHHLHLGFEDAARIGSPGKPEAYYFPPQYNNYPGSFPHTYFGFSPEVTKDQVRERLECYETADGRITELSRAFRIQLGTGWYTAPGVVHAPGSYLTYEPQWNADVNSHYENITRCDIYPYEQLVECCPEDKKRDMDYILGLMDWEKNVDPDYRKHYFRPPIVMAETPEYTQKWIVYANPYLGGQELTVQPKCSVTIKNNTAYGCVVVQGRGKIGGYKAESPTMIRFGQLTADEFFVSEATAREGVTIVNESDVEPLVILKHFGPNDPDTPKCTEE